MNLSPEKQKIIEQEGNVLVTANPGTGKTLLLANKYVNLIQKGTNPEEILCLTFTDKAKREMEARIIQYLDESKLEFDYSKLKIYTFHSYALEHIDEQSIISSNLLRYAIFEYLKENEILNYADHYLIDTIVPKMENLIRYLKSFGITPDQINIKEAKKFLREGKSWTKEEIDIYADQFVKIYEHYEKIKNKKGFDYTDLLLSFLKLNKFPQFEMVLIDELQDVNKMEADIALKSAKQFFAVGDKKQAIFGFQGGSILNFKKFSNSKQFVLSENFRSTNEILTYSKNYFISKTKDEDHKNELKDLKNNTCGKAKKPVIYEIDKDNICSTACMLTKQLLKEKSKIAIITRTNHQILDIARELKNNGIECSSTFFSASNDAKRYIIDFLKGMLGDDVQLLKNSMFTPFFPIPLQEAFALAKDKHMTLQVLYEKCPEFKKLRERFRTVEDINDLFKERIVPIAITYGKEYLFAAHTIQEAFQEALNVIEDKNFENLISYLVSSDLLSSESDTEKQVTLTTIHKAKGKEYDYVVYIPSKTSNRSNFQDTVVEAILESKGINAKEELEEETLRVNFVAFTRAKEKLLILTDKPQEYLNEDIVVETPEVEPVNEETLDESKKRAFSLFVDGKFDEAKKLLENKDSWLIDFVKGYFDDLDHISFSNLADNAYEYFCNVMLNVREGSPALSLGGEVHKIAEKSVNGEKFESKEEYKHYEENIKKLIGEIKKDYPDVENTEVRIDEPLSSFMDTKDKVNFKGFIDAIFKNKDKYLIVDWKTDKNASYSSKHRQQLESYRRSYATKHKIPLENVKIAIGFIGLRNAINTGNIESELDMKQPAKSAFETFAKKVNMFLSWKKDAKVFLDEIKENKNDDLLWKSVVEQYEKEKSNT